MQLAKVEVIFAVNSSNRATIEEEVKKQLDYLFPIYKIGDRFTNISEQTEYILAKVDSAHVTLIQLTTGNRWGDYIKVEDIFNVTSQEFISLTGTYNRASFIKK